MAEQEEHLTVDSLRGYLLKHNGKVKHEDLVHHFKGALSNPETREGCKTVLQLITATKTEQGEKYIVLVNNKTTDKHHSKKSNRPLFFRKDQSKTKHNKEYLSAPRVKRGSSSDNEDLYVQRPMSVVSNESTDSGHGQEAGSSTPIPPVRSKRAGKKARGKGRTKSIESGDIQPNEVTIGAEILPDEKEWFLASANGHVDSLRKLLNANPKLSSNRDFVFGYTALHWAAKLGRSDILNMLIASGVDVHTKSHGGYTALHVAAMSGKDHVITQLIDIHHADIHARDYSGKKAKDVVKETVSADVQRRLGRTVILAPDWVLTDLHARKGTTVHQPSIISP